jgi:hypothetical protein
MATVGSSDDDNGSFMPEQPDIYEAAQGFEPADTEAAEAEQGHLRRTPGGVPEPPHRSLAERIRESMRDNHG